MGATLHQQSGLTRALLNEIGEQNHREELNRGVGHDYFSLVHPWKQGEDLFVKLSPSGSETNIGVSCSFGSAGYNWGYEGSGPSHLALNILNQLIPPGRDGKPPISLREYGCPFEVSHTAHSLAGHFERELLGPCSLNPRPTVAEITLDTPQFVSPEVLVAEVVYRSQNFRISPEFVLDWVSAHL